MSGNKHEEETRPIKEGNDPRCRPLPFAVTLEATEGASAVSLLILPSVPRGLKSLVYVCSFCEGIVLLR